MDFLLVLTWLAMAIGAGAIASSKGRSGFGYFLLGFFFPLIGLLIAIGMSSRAPVGVAISDNSLVKCPQCYRPRKASSASCPHCGAGKIDAHSAHKKCPACAEWILTEAKKCKHCGETVGPAVRGNDAHASQSRASGMGYCPGCKKLRHATALKCVYCGNTEIVSAS